MIEKLSKWRQVLASGNGCALGPVIASAFMLKIWPAIRNSIWFTELSGIVEKPLLCSHLQRAALQMAMWRRE